MRFPGQVNGRSTLEADDVHVGVTRDCRIDDDPPIVWGTTHHEQFVACRAVTCASGRAVGGQPPTPRPTPVQEDENAAFAAIARKPPRSGRRASSRRTS